MPGDVVERERRLDEVEQALALALDQVLLDLRRATSTVIAPVRCRSASAIAVRAPTRLRPVRRAPSVVDAARPRLAARSGNCAAASACDVGRSSRLVGQRHVQRRRVRVLDDQRVQIVQRLR